MKLFKFLTFFTISFLFAEQTHAFVCYLTMVKDTCWKEHSLTVEASDASTGGKLVSITVPKGKGWGRVQFDCKSGQTLALLAKFEPAIWQGQENKTYPAQRYWKLPHNIESGVTGWNVTVCFPKWFADVPAHPKATVNCQCDTSDIPPVAPLKK